MLPSASVRSSTSTRRSRSTIGVKSPHKPQVRRRSRRRISRTSRKPQVVITPIFGPRRSSSVLVPTVVPCTIEPMLTPKPTAAMPCMNPADSSPRCEEPWRYERPWFPRRDSKRSGKGPADVDAQNARNLHWPAPLLRAAVAAVSTAPFSPMTTPYSLRAAAFVT